LLDRKGGAVPDLIDALLVAAPLAVVPLARPLLPVDHFPRRSLVAVAAVAFAAAFGFGDPGLPALLALPWLAVAVAAASRAGLRIVRLRDFRAENLALVAAHAFLVVGAFFAVASRAGWTVTGISDPIVELTGVHFHYAGFAAMTLALCFARAPRVPTGAARIVLALGIVGPPIVAAGFTGKLAACQIGGALVMTAFTWMIAALTIFFVARDSSARARTLLTISALSVLAPMVLGVAWATAQYFSVPALSIPAMARVHGTMNALGFVGCGVLGWRVRYADLRSSTTRDQRSGSLR
jgi:hypothetical protein